jgi:ferredoxin
LSGLSVRAVVDPLVCEGHALCLSHAPAIFDMGADERAYVTGAEITAELMPGLRAAIEACPTQAIRLADGQDYDRG